MGDEDKTAIETAMERGKAALKQDDHDEIVSTAQEIEDAVGVAAQKMYAAAGEASGGPDMGMGTDRSDVEMDTEKEEDVIEADYEIVEEAE